MKRRFKKIGRLGAAAALVLGVVTASEALASTPSSPPNDSLITVCGGVGTPPNNWTIPCPQSPPPCFVKVGPSDEFVTWLFLCEY